MNSKTGEEEFDSKTIAKNYLYGRFWIDLFASLPLDSLGSLILGGGANFLKSFGLLKLIRIFRLNKIMMYLNFKEDVKMSLNLVKLMFMLVMFIHCQGCAWYLMIKDSKEWIPPLDWLYAETQMFESSLSLKYWTMIYYSTNIMSGGDIGPINVAQLIFCTTALIV